MMRWFISTKIIQFMSNLVQILYVVEFVYFFGWLGNGVVGLFRRGLLSHWRRLEQTKLNITQSRHSQPVNQTSKPNAGAQTGSSAIDLDETTKTFSHLLSFVIRIFWWQNWKKCSRPKFDKTDTKTIFLYYKLCKV